ncbi:MAG TPA: hypothetical protein VFG76_03810, partial [Candidatus Polarisedimenticolia bacterium]|nr:hypothetical protein [Candidatus Polarisedimenticolia bacterium]
MNRMVKACVIGMTWALCTVAAAPSDQIESEERSQRAEREARDAEDRADELELYEEGTAALDEAEWEDAVAAFTKVSRMGGAKADGAL